MDMLGIRVILASILVLTMVSSPVKATDSSVPFIDADAVHAQGITGAGATVAVIDFGVVYGHPGLQDGIAPGGISIIDGVEIPDGGADPGPPGESHGTYMSLIITDATGVAPDALILPVRVAFPDDVVLAVQYVIDRRQTVDPTIRVINLSLAAPSYYGPCSCDDDWPDMAEKIFNAAGAGIVTFAATGNEAECGGICAPACVSAAVRVAADYDGHYQSAYFDPPADCMDLWPPPYWVTCFSNVAEDCDWFLAAPGYDISVGGFSGHGTSQATAHCSGVAALMFSKAPCGLGGWSARQIIWWNALVRDWGWPYCPLPPQPKHVNAYYAVGATPAMPCIKADMNCDGSVGFGDINPFVLALSKPVLYSQTYPTCNIMNGDINADGLVGFGDINPFVTCVAQGGCP
jgi:subtilisin family serine protease